LNHIPVSWNCDIYQHTCSLFIIAYYNVCLHFRNKKKAYLKAKIEELETNSKINNIRDLYRGINDFKKGYQPRNTILKEEKGDLVTGSHSIMEMWRNYFSQILVSGGTDWVYRGRHVAGG
jgi:hypothetical protein